MNEPPRSQNQAREREAHYEVRRGPDGLDMLMILPYIRVPQSELQMMLRAAEEKAAAAAERGTRAGES